MELIGGELVVSPTPDLRHSDAIDELTDLLTEVKRLHRWRIHTNATIHISATRERLMPDLAVAPRDAARFSAWELISASVLLAAEMVSPSSQRRARAEKPRAYAQGGVPLYLLIDKFASPPAVTLFSEPGDNGYGRRQTATAGRSLELPEPFGITVDAASLLS